MAVFEDDFALKFIVQDSREDLKMGFPLIVSEKTIACILFIVSE